MKPKPQAPDRVAPPAAPKRRTVHHRLYWTAEKIAARLELIRPLIQRRRAPLPPFRFTTLAGPEVEPPVAPDVDVSDWDVIPPDTYWGAWATDFVLRSAFTVPADWTDGPVALHLPLGAAGDIFTHPEALLYIDGQAYASADRYHHEIHLPDDLRDGEHHVLALHGWTGLSGWPPDPDDRKKLFMRECAVVELDEATAAFVSLAQMALDVAGELDDERPEKHRILNALNDAFVTLETRDPLRTAAFYASVPPALATLKAGLAAAGPPLDVDIVATGHAHIDVAYLWRVAQTRHKVGRTFSNALHLMDAFSDYRFSSSQALLYRFAEEDYPEVFDGIRRRVAEGRWEILGGMWVEADCNIAGPEALVRQLLLGRSYVRERFGDATTPVLWLPDTFGFCWSLPQPMSQAGLKWFVTNKLGWHQYNPMPAQITWWQGLDGTRVLTHFLTTPRPVEHLPFPTTYKAEMTAAEVVGTWRGYRQKEGHGELLMAYGYGDGGGGPTRELIASARTLQDMPGAPRVRMGTVREFFEGIEAAGTDDLPVWNGELYMEGHRGVLTSEARIKRHNRKSEVLLHDAEFAAAFAATVAGHTYPASALAQAWELLCRNQFHDILPGTSIPEVFEDAEQDYAEIASMAGQALENALDAIAAALKPETAVLALNPTPHTGTKIGLLADAAVAGLADLETGTPLVTQTVDGGTLVALPALPAYAAVGLTESAAPQEAPTNLAVHEDAAVVVLENDLIRVEIDAEGRLSRVFDKEVERDVLARGAVGNQLQAFEDRPLVWDAWDIDAYFEERGETIGGCERREIVETGPLRATVRVERRYRDSRIVQRISLRHDGKRIDFDTEVDWHESHILLKAAFPVSVLSPKATFDIQWGSIERPTHRNTSWDFAKFEVAAQRWADLSEGDYGVALLNDCKYGYDVRDNVMRLSLIKCATMPNPGADQGEHRFTYSLLPHTGDWRNGVAVEAADLNDPVLLSPVSEAAGDATARQLVTTDRANAVIETIKAAEDGDGFVVRLYEGERARGPATVRFGVDVAAVVRCNLLEEPEAELAVEDNRVTLDLRPYEIVTLRCRPA